MKNAYAVVLFLSCWVNLLSQPFPCDRTMYMVLTPAVGQAAELKRLNVDVANSQGLFSNTSNPLNIQINALGYCVADGYLYGVDPLVGTLYKIGANGQASNLGIPQGLNTEYEYYAGDVTPNGRTLLLLGRSRDDKIDRVLYSINLEGPTYFAGYLSIVCDWGSSIGDIAIDPQFGVIRGFDNATHRLVNISSGGNVTSTALEGNGQISMGSLFFDLDGNLFGYGSGSGPESSLYKIDINNGRAEFWDSWINGRFTDGCSCPYRFQFLKEALDSLVLPCTETTLRYTLLNSAGTAFSQIELRDTLPPGFEIISVSGLSSLSIVESGPGSSILHIRKVEAILGENTIDVRVRVGPIPGIYASQARISPLSYALGGSLQSDNPRVAGGPEPTPIQIIEGPMLLSDSLLFLCNGLERVLATTVGAESYQWSSGQSSPAITVQTPGWYVLSATTPCGVFVDSIEIKNIDIPVFIDLGPDTVIIGGDPYFFNYQTNGLEPITFNWITSTDSVSLSCQQCPHPEVRPLVPATYTVQISDANGCQTTDAQSIQVLPNVRFFYPNAFSPNNDGINDHFFFQGKAGVGIRSMVIYDRWGSQVFSGKNGVFNDPLSGWDGMIGQKTAAAGTYLFVAEIQRLDNSILLVSDAFQLIR